MSNPCRMLLAFAVSLVVSVTTGAGQGDVITVGPTGDFVGLRDGIDAASDGDHLVLVASAAGPLLLSPRPRPISFRRSRGSSPHIDAHLGCHFAHNGPTTLHSTLTLVSAPRCP